MLPICFDEDDHSIEKYVHFSASPWLDKCSMRCYYAVFETFIYPITELYSRRNLPTRYCCY